MAAPGSQQVRTFCRLCEVGCGLVATVTEGRLERLRPDHAHPVTQGYACGKGLRATNPLWMHPDDGARLGLDAGARATISNPHGSIEAGVRYDPRLRAGVVAMTHGFGNAATSGMPRAHAHPGVNVNVLAPHGPGTFDPVSCMSQVTAIPVDVRPTEPSPS